jgi:hypothetical protein
MDFITCFLALATNAGMNSGHLFIPQGTVANERDAVAVINTIAKTHCEPQEPSPLEVYSAKCTRVKRGHNFSEMCYVETKAGYFFLTPDILDGINVIYNRWD